MVVSINELMEMTGKTFRTVKKYIAPLKPVREDGRAAYYDSAEALKLLYPTHTSEMDQEQLKYERARREKMEIEVAELRGELIPIGEVAKTLSKEFAFVRAQVRAVPSKLAKPLSMVTDPHKAFEMLSEAIDECLAELTQDAKYQLDSDKLDASRASSADSPVDGNATDAEIDLSGMVRSETLSESGSLEHTGALED